MVNLIERDYPQYFTQTSDKPYDRHNYRVIDSQGKFVIVDSWEEAHQIWWNTPSQFLSHIEVLDKKEKKGFK